MRQNALHFKQQETNYKELGTFKICHEEAGCRQNLQEWLLKVLWACYFYFCWGEEESGGDL